MTFDIAVVLLVLTLAIILFATEKLRVDLVALIVVAVLLATGIISAEEGVAGFSNQATVTVAAMMILSGGLTRSGALNPVASALQRLAERGARRGAAALLLTVAGVSAFINNTAAVAIFLPIVLRIARAAGTSPSKLLIPLSFAGIFGGTCTLIGTSTNILIDTIATGHGQRPFGMFEFASVGVVLLVVGMAYLLTAGPRLLPARRKAGDLTRDFDLADYVLDLEVPEGSASVGRKLSELGFLHKLDAEILDLSRGSTRMSLPPGDAEVQAGDRLRLRCGALAVVTLRRREDIIVRPLTDLRDEDLEGDAVLVEAVVPASAPIVGETVADLEIADSYGAALLAIRHRGSVMHERLDRTRLGSGDLLLLEVPRGRLDRLRRGNAIVPVSEQEIPAAASRSIPAGLVVAGVIVTASVGFLPIVSAAVIGCVIMVLTRCLSMRHAYDSIDWQVIFLLAGALSLGTAMESTGTAELIASGIVGAVGRWGPQALISAFYLLTALLTAAMSNNATAALLAPIAITTATSLGLDSRPFLMAVAFGASASFLTPVGYQTNTLVYGPGQYRFLDFMRVGAPLVLVFWILATVLIPVVWPP